MSAPPGEASAATGLLSVLADPAVIVDGSGTIQAWNAAAAAYLSIDADAVGRPLEAVVGARATDARRAKLVEPDRELLVWGAPAGAPPTLDADAIALEKLDLIGRLSGGVAHELKNPLGAIMGLSELVGMDRRLDADLRDIASQLFAYAQRVHRMTDAVLAFARHDQGDVRTVSPGPIVRDLVSLLGHSTINMDVRIMVPDELPPVEASPAVIRQAILGLLVHALEAQGTQWVRGASPAEHGRLVVSGRYIDDAQGNRVRLAIEDGGPVIPECDRGTLFDGGPAGGRDLAVVRELVTRAGGRVSYEPLPDGNRLVVELPVSGTSRPPDPPNLPPPLILICDDEAFLRTLIVRFIERAKLRAVEARDGREALDILASEHVDVVVSDLQMGGLGGAELYDAAVARDPALARRFILTSGDPGSPEVLAFVARTGVPVVPKPFVQGQLEALIREVLER